MRPDLKAAVEGVSYQIYKRYRRFVDPEDLRQEMYMWAYAQKPERLDEIPAATLRWRLRDVGDHFARGEKAAKSGYSQDDEVFYAVRVIRELLPHAVTDTPVVLRGVDEQNGPSGKRAGAVPSMDYETAIADLRKAYKGLGDRYRTILAEYAMGKMVDEADVNKALRAMQRGLGGRRPQIGDA